MTASISILQFCCFCIMSGRLLLCFFCMLAAVQMEWPGSCVSNETPICRRGALYVENTSSFCLTGHSEMCDMGGVAFHCQ